MKAHIRTYGCQMNERDSENIAANFVERGWSITNNEAEADAIIVNTCSVREQAENKAIGKLGHLINYRNFTGKNLPVIGVTGCMAQNRGGQLVKILPGLDFVAGARKTHKVADIAEQIYRQKITGRADLVPVVDVSDDLTSHLNIDKHYPLARSSKVCAFVSIMQGCQMNCSYCIVPKVRGPMRSRPTADIVAEVRALVDSGVKEVTLLGQVVNAFGIERRAPGKVSEFVDLLERLNAIEGLQRIRFTSPHPSFFKDDLIEAYGRLEKLCQYVHLPLQSGSNSILRAMNRPYRAEDFLRIAERLREKVADMSISTDVIVGYPGETPEDFRQTVDVFKQAAFDMAFIFKYSPREGTKSAQQPDDVPESIKDQRNKILLEILGEQSMRFHENMIGRTFDVLVEDRAKRGQDMFMGRTRNHRKCIFKADESYIANTVNVKINSATVTALSAAIVG